MNIAGVTIAGASIGPSERLRATALLAANVPQLMAENGLRLGPWEPVESA